MLTYDYYCEVIAFNIKQRREIKGFTQSEIAQCIGVSRKTILDIESNKTSLKVKTLLKLADCLSCNINELLYEPSQALSTGDNIVSMLSEGGIALIGTKKEA
ncbi:helix-turn-helix transcriptional regulator [Photobacterium rosenbergii]|uniref:Helix-turn-helix transcriptional regulator n=1 Tax=Photobacterium rosenbergii TaxID=294936 RepID=A0ABU3ZDY4_9GAMM|nr:helix-turn-helix transcriptional regulator [Photobacterium rosenbergii]MDV5168316.1 helix-turn-helix transcriptional regulator [Photobacterium rosenbergii]